ncbi:MAG: caspase family protein [Henriciella sp.]
MRHILALITLSLLASISAHAEERLALIVANSDYESSIGRLANPANDAAVMKAALEDVGFSVTVSNDLDQRGLRRALRDHSDRLDAAGKGAVSFFYYSGHGAADSESAANYLVPLSAVIGRPSDLPIEGVSVNDVVRSFRQSKQNFVVIDACRNFPFPFANSRSIQKGMVPQKEQLGTLIAFATSPGTTASDEGADSGPYARALAAQLRVPGADHINIFKSVQVDVLAATNNQQFPWFRDGVPGRFQFTAAPVGLTTPTTIASVAAPASATRSLAKRDPIIDARYTPVTTKAPVISGSPSDLPAYSLFRECDTCPEMVSLPAGSIDWQTETTGKFDTRFKGPETRVQIKRFAVGRFEVTFEEWDVCAEINYCKGRGPYHPNQSVEQKRDAIVFDNTLGWDVVDGKPEQASNYLEYLSALTGGAYRLPSDAEWVYAARSQTSTKFYWGDQAPACNDFEASNGARTCTPPYAKTVGDFKPNNFGLYDMIGNVWEIVTACGADPEIRAATECGRLHARGGDTFQGPWRGSENDRPERLNLDLGHVSGKGLRVVREL